MKLNYPAASALAAIAMLAPAAARADDNIIANGSFESITAGNIDNWTLTPTAASGAVTDYPTATGTSPYGTHFLSFNSGLGVPGGSATQDFNTLPLGVTYQVSFVYGAFGTSGAQDLVVTINQTSVTIPQQMYTVNTPSTDFGTLWQPASFTFTGDDLPLGITFADAGVATALGDSDLLVDNVSIVALPEPATAMLLPIAGLALARRRRAR